MISQKIIRETVSSRMTDIYNNIRNAESNFNRNNIPKTKEYLDKVKLDAESVVRWIDGIK